MLPQANDASLSCSLWLAVLHLLFVSVVLFVIVVFIFIGFIPGGIVVVIF